MAVKETELTTGKKIKSECNEVGMELKLKSDTAKRKRLFTPTSFAHPAKCHIGMLEWILQEYTQEGDVVLDPMAGSGSILIGTLMGRHIVCVELEDKFVKMAEDNLKKISQLALYLGTKERGTATILQGDTRNLTGLLADKILFSPPYANTEVLQEGRVRSERKIKTGGYNPLNDTNIGNLPYGSVDKIVSSPPYGSDERYGRTLTENSIGGREPRMNMVYGRGDISAIVTSPPYEGTIGPHNENFEGVKRYQKGETREAILEERRKGTMGYSGVDAVITSPPYEGTLQATPDDGLNDARRLEELTKANPNRKWKRKTELTPGRMRAWGVMGSEYSPDNSNIGNLKSTDYLSAMLQVYEQCYAVLRPGGLMILITKNFIRDQKEIRLDSDTISLCEGAGFTFKERHFRRLTQQSFWRTIYAQKYPSAPKLDREDILVFGKRLDA